MKYSLRRHRIRPAHFNCSSDILLALNTKENYAELTPSVLIGCDGLVCHREKLNLLAQEDSKTLSVIGFMSSVLQ